MSKKLWEHQSEAIERILATAQDSSGERFHVVKVPTGGGKTLIGVKCVRELLRDQDKYDLGSNGTCLWLAPNSNLLLQAAEEVQKEWGLSQDHMAHVGSKNLSTERIFLQKTESVSSKYKVLFCSFGTFMKSPFRFQRKFPNLVVVDEVHYAEFAPTQENLRKKFANSSDRLLLGFTATPHNNSRYGSPVYEISMAELVSRGILAEPKKFLPTLIPDSSLRKEFVQSLIDRSDHEDEKSDSTGRDKTLSELAKDKQRNIVIAKTIVERRDLLGKTIVFAIDQEHCEILQKCLRDQRVYGHESAIVTCHEGNADQIMEDFRHNRNGYKVLITVRKAIHGYDVPDLKSVVIARPTKSPKLHRQMIGRAARGNNGKKKCFYVLDFFDSFNLLNENFGSFGTYSPSSEDPIGRSFGDKKVFKEYSYKSDQPITDEFVVPAFDNSSEPFVLPMRNGQRFGFEIELAIGKDDSKVSDSEWKANATTLRDAMYSQIGGRLVNKKIRREKDESSEYGKWKVTHDSTCGWEIVSRILEGKDGIVELEDVLRSVSPFCDDSNDTRHTNGFFKVDYRTGLHLNLGYAFSDGAHLKRFLHLVRYIEPGLASIVSPSRICEYGSDLKRPNDAATSLRWAFSYSNIEAAIGTRGKLDLDVLIDAVSKKSDLEFDSDYDMKYFSVNLQQISERSPKVEIRLHNGTWEISKMGVWLSLWMFLFYASEQPDLADKINFKCDQKMPIPTDLEDDDICYILSEKLNAPLNLVQAVSARRMNDSLLRSWEKLLGAKVKRNVAAWESRLKNQIRKRIG